MPYPEGHLIKGRFTLAGSPKCTGSAEVYKAVDVRNNFRPVAVKVLTSIKHEQDILAKMFEQETQALRELRHTSIVELIDADTDESTGKSFLVLEWMESILSDWIKASPLADWNSFYNEIGKDLLEALAFAHSRNWAHRDVKPGNILMSKEGHAKLGDFGISKLMLDLQAGLTLREFHSRPFTPPETDDGEFTFTRDVFGFGTIVLTCLTNVTLKDYPDIKVALAKLDAPQDVKAQIARSVSLDPSERPETADVLEARALMRENVEALGLGGVTNILLLRCHPARRGSPQRTVRARVSRPA